MDAKAPLPTLADQEATWAYILQTLCALGLNQLADRLHEKGQLPLSRTVTEVDLVIR